MVIRVSENPVGASGLNPDDETGLSPVSNPDGEPTQLFAKKSVGDHPGFMEPG